MHVLNLVGIVFSRQLVRTAGSHLLKKGPRSDQDNCSLSSAFDWVSVVFVPFHTSVERYQSGNKR